LGPSLSECRLSLGPFTDYQADAMAAAEPLTDALSARRGEGTLSGFERRCLLKHICECHELLQLTLLGAASARDKLVDASTVAGIQEALRAAELQVARAEWLALRLLNTDSGC
jgi:hypothetical protein